MRHAVAAREKPELELPERIQAPQSFELWRAYLSAKTLAEQLEVDGLEAEARAVRSLRGRLWSHLSGLAYVDIAGKVVRP